MKNHNKKILGISLGLVTMMFLAGPAQSGSLEPSGPPGPTMKSLQQIYEKVHRVDELLSRVLNHRFFIRGDGSVTDVTTGLIWDQYVGRFSFVGRWDSADYDCSELAANSDSSILSAHPLTDGSTVGYWRLPTKDELLSVLDTNFTGPALSNAEGLSQWSEGDAFFDVTWSSKYWTSTLDAQDPPNADSVSLNDGSIQAQTTDPDDPAPGSALAWCVH